MTSERLLRCSYYAREPSGRKPFVKQLSAGTKAGCRPELKFRLYIRAFRNLERGSDIPESGAWRRNFSSGGQLIPAGHAGTQSAGSIQTSPPESLVSELRQCRVDLRVIGLNAWVGGDLPVTHGA
jgi:hypothetical protein